MSEHTEPSVSGLVERDTRMRSLSNVIDRLDDRAVLLCAVHPYLTDDVRSILTENATLRSTLEAYERVVEAARPYSDDHKRNLAIQYRDNTEKVRNLYIATHVGACRICLALMAVDSLALSSSRSSDSPTGGSK